MSAQKACLYYFLLILMPCACSSPMHGAFAVFTQRPDFERKGAELSEVFSEKFGHRPLYEEKIFYEIAKYERPIVSQVALIFDNNIAVLQTDLERRKIFWLLGHTRQVKSAVFSPDKRKILTAAADNTARLWNAQTGAPLCRYDGHTSRVNSAVFSPQGDLVLTASDDLSARLWDVETCALIHTFDGHSAEVWDAQFFPDGQRIYTSTRLGSWHSIWDVFTKRSVLTSDLPQELIVKIVPDGQSVLSLSLAGEAQIWTLEPRQLQCTFAGSMTPRGWMIAEFSPDSQQVLVHRDGPPALWDTQNGTEIRKLDWREPSTAVYSAMFSPQGDFALLTSRFGSRAHLFETATGRLVEEFFIGSSPLDSVTRVNDRVIASFADGSTMAWNAQTGEQL